MMGAAEEVVAPQLFVRVESSSLLLPQQCRCSLKECWEAGTKHAAIALGDRGIFW